MPQRSTPLTIELAFAWLCSRPAVAWLRDPSTPVRPRRALAMSGDSSSPLLYAHLKRLEAEGFLAATVEVQSDRPARRLLAITAAGEAVFVRWLAQPVTRGRDLRLEFLAKLFFARSEGQEMALHLLDMQQRQICCWLDDIAAQRRELAPEAIYERLVLDYRSGQVNAALQWLAMVRSELASSAEVQR